jgi:hypothetical protein
LVKVSAMSLSDDSSSMSKLSYASVFLFFSPALSSSSTSLSLLTQDSSSSDPSMLEESKTSTFLYHIFLL